MAFYVFGYLSGAIARSQFLPQSLRVNDVLPHVHSTSHWFTHSLNHQIFIKCLLESHRHNSTQSSWLSLKIPIACSVHHAHFGTQPRRLLCDFSPSASPLLGDGVSLGCNGKEGWAEKCAQRGQFQGKAPERPAAGWAGHSLVYHVGQVTLPFHSFSWSHIKVEEFGFLWNSAILLNGGPKHF